MKGSTHHHGRKKTNQIYNKWKSLYLLPPLQEEKEKQTIDLENLIEINLKNLQEISSRIEFFEGFSVNKCIRGVLCI